MPEPGDMSTPAEPERTSPGSSLPAQSSDSGSGAAGSPLDLAIDAEAVERIGRLAAEYVETIASLDGQSPRFRHTLAAIERLGERDFVATAAISGRILDRRFRATNALLTAKAPTARNLAELRKAAGELDPARLKLGGDRSSDGELRELDRYFTRFAKAQPRLEALLDSLGEARFTLDQDNAAIDSELTSLAVEMETLRQYAFLAARLDDEMAARIGLIEQTDRARADALRVDVLLTVKQRRREILVQLAVATQGYAALRLVEDTNAEVIEALAAAVSTTLVALRTAVVVAQAAASQRMAIGHLEAARMAATSMAETAAALEAGLTDPGARVAVLKAAWDDVRAAVDRVDAQKALVLKTISAADRELTRAKTPDR
jgi:uncharacterized protein YaaN involved in tellurite resistance